MYTFEEYLSHVPAAFHEALHRVRALVLETRPAIKESIKWSVPFYTYHTPLCYLNVSKGKLYLSFYRGADFPHHWRLVSEGRKQVRLVYIDPQAIPYEDLAELLEQGVSMQEKGIT